MKKKKELPRKRKRFIRKVYFFSLFILIIFIIGIGVAFYFLFITFQKPLYVSPIPLVNSITQTLVDKSYNELQIGLKKDQIDYSSIVRANQAYEVTLTGGGKVTFSSQKDIMTQIASLQYILSHLTMEGRQFSSLDLRFDKPVIVIK